MKFLRNTLLLLIVTTLQVAAQPYDNAVGIKAGYSSGVTFKHFIKNEITMEAQALYNPHGFLFTAIYGYQFTPYSKKRLHYYAGAGLHTGNWDNEFALGAAILAGSEYVFREVPIVVGIEWKPMINFYKLFDYALPDVAVTFRVVIN